MCLDNQKNPMICFAKMIGELFGNTLSEETPMDECCELAIEELKKLKKNKELLSRATRFDAGFYPVVFGDLTSNLLAQNKSISEYECVVVEKRSKTQWAICHGHDCLGKDGKWEYEPMPSSRSESFIQQTRFDSAQEALAFYEQWKQQSIQDFKDGKFEV
jgi:hypothetical protein